MIKQSKFWLSVGILVAAVTLLVRGYIEPEIWERVVLGVVGAYVTGNVWATYAHGRRSAQ